MAADPKYGGRVQVDFTGVMVTLQGKLNDDCDALRDLLASDEGRHNFETQVTLLKEIQASVRTLDVLRGEVDINGETSSAGLATELKRQEARISINAQKGVDADQLADAIGQSLAVASITKLPTEPLASDTEHVAADPLHTY